MPFDWSLVEDAAFQLGQSHRGIGDSPEAQSAVKAHLDGLEAHLTKGDAAGRVTNEEVKAAGEAFRKAYMRGLEGTSLAEAHEGGPGGPDVHAPAAPDAHLQAANSEAAKGVFARVLNHIRDFAAKLKLTGRHADDATSPHEHSQDAKLRQPPKLPNAAGVFKLEGTQFSALEKLPGADQKKAAAANIGAASAAQPNAAPAQEQHAPRTIPTGTSPSAQAAPAKTAAMTVGAKRFAEPAPSNPNRMPAGAVSAARSA